MIRVLRTQLESDTRFRCKKYSIPKYKIETNALVCDCKINCNNGFLLMLPILKSHYESYLQFRILVKLVRNLSDRTSEQCETLYIREFQQYNGVKGFIWPIAKLQGGQNNSGNKGT